MKNLKDCPLSEITLRKYPKPINLESRELVKKLCLSLGLLNPGDSRDVVVDVFHAFIAHKELKSNDVLQKIVDLRKKNNHSIKGTTYPNVRRQIRRLQNLHLIEKKENIYQITEQNTLLQIFEEKIEKFYLQGITERVKEYLVEIGKI